MGDPAFTKRAICLHGPDEMWGCMELQTLECPQLTPSQGKDRNGALQGDECGRSTEGHGLVAVLG